MKKCLLIFLCLLFIKTCAFAKHDLPEKYYQKIWCDEQKGEMEHLLPDGTRVDCLTLDYAVEFDFAPKWAESIGQSLYYASKTARRPGIVLIIENKKDFKYYYRIKRLCEDYNIALWYINKPKHIDTSAEIKDDIITIIVNFILNLFNEIVKIFM